MPNPLDLPEDPTPSRTPDPVVENEDRTQKTPLSIENKPSAPSTDGAQNGEETKSLDLGEGFVVKLDKLGPMIVNTDGTLSRIQNWQELHPIEQERTVRLLVKKRNLVRLKKLDSDNQASAQGNEEALTALKEG